MLLVQNGRGLEELGGLVGRIGHHSGLQHVEGVASNGSNGAGQRPSRELQNEVRVAGHAHGVLDRSIQSNTERGVGSLAQPSCSDAFPECCCAFFPGNACDGSGDTKSLVVLGTGRSITRYLQTSLHNINRVTIQL